jgi:hypothetical protein
MNSQEPKPSGLYAWTVEGHLYYGWYSMVTCKVGVGWYSRESACSEKRYLLLKARSLPLDATLVAPKKSNNPCYQRYQNLVFKMDQHERKKILQ